MRKAIWHILISLALCNLHCATSTDHCLSFVKPHQSNNNLTANSIQTVSSPDDNIRGTSIRHRIKPGLRLCASLGKILNNTSERHTTRLSTSTYTEIRVFATSFTVSYRWTWLTFLVFMVHDNEDNTACAHIKHGSECGRENTNAFGDTNVESCFRDTSILWGSKGWHVYTRRHKYGHRPRGDRTKVRIWL